MKMKVWARFMRLQFNACEKQQKFNLSTPTFEDLSKSSTTKLFNNFEARLQNFLALLKHVVLH
jgi:hypothetical protein